MVKDTLCKQHVHHCSILAHMHLLHPIQACDLVNQLPKKLVRHVKARSQKQNLLSPC